MTIFLLGTAHILDIKERVKAKIVEIGPDAVAIELDRDRYERILNPNYLDPNNPQERIAELYGARAGDDMRGGIEGARETHAGLYLIDKDIKDIYKELSQIQMNPVQMTQNIFASFPKILKLGSEYARILFQNMLSGKGNNPQFLIDFFITEVERNPKLYRELTGLASPRFKEVLLDERENYMADQIKNIAMRNDSIVVVTGLAHIYGLKNLLKDEDVRDISMV